MDVRVPFAMGRLVALWAHLKIPEGSHGGCRNRSLGSEGSVPPSMGSHSRDTRLGLGYDWQRCADPLRGSDHGLYCAHLQSSLAWSS